MFTLPRQHALVLLCNINSQ